MKATPRPSRPRTDFSYVSFGNLLVSVATCGARPNVRLMEELLARDAPAKDYCVTAALHHSVSRAAGAGEPVAVWLAVVAGAMRAPAVAPALLRMLREVPEGDDLPSLVAAEALARIGGPAVDGVAELARDGDWRRRIWAYASLGWNADPRAGEVLLRALAGEHLVLDAVANALADRGDVAAVPALLDALAARAPDERAVIEEAIRDLHQGDRDRPIDRDWRLRYLPDPDLGQIDFGWPGSAVIMREEDGRMPGLIVPQLRVRTLPEILADREPIPWMRVDPDGNPLCECCDARMWVFTAVWVCPATAMTVAWIQDRWLTRARDEARLDDLFDVLDMLEDEIETLYDALAEGRSLPETPWDQDEVDPATAIGWARHGVAWLVEQGIDDVDAGAERIRQEATRLVGLKALAKSARGSGGRPSLN